MDNKFLLYIIFEQYYRNNDIVEASVRDKTLRPSNRLLSPQRQRHQFD